MALKLGIPGSEYTLSHAITESLPVEVAHPIEEAVMADGTKRYGFFDTGRRRWSLTWAILSAAELSTLITIRNYNAMLGFQNTDEASTWYHVVVKSFSYDVISLLPTVYYSAQMTIEEMYS